MRRSIRAIASLALVAGLVTGPAASVALAASPREPTGTRISLFACDQAFPASTAFYVTHGISEQPREGSMAIGRDLFVLELDGVRVAPTYAENFYVAPELMSMWVFNFPKGLTGTHAFVGHWMAPCGARPSLLPCDGAVPNTPVDFNVASITVTFTE